MEEHLKKVHGAITDLWKIYKEYAMIAAAGHIADAQYNDLIDRTKAIWEGCNEDRMIQDLCCIFVASIERMDV